MRDMFHSIFNVSTPTTESEVGMEYLRNGNIDDLRTDGTEHPYYVRIVAHFTLRPLNKMFTEEPCTGFIASSKYVSKHRMYFNSKSSVNMLKNALSHARFAYTLPRVHDESASDTAVRECEGERDVFICLHLLSERERKIARVS